MSDLFRPRQFPLQVTQEKREEEAHAREVDRLSEEAKNPAAYESYLAQKDARLNLSVFGARRIGKSHVQKGKPCQDACLTASGKGCFILTAADGVGSCDLSQIGSRLACEAAVTTVKSAAEHCGSEDELTQLLCSLRFRERLVNRWVNLVIARIKDARRDDAPNLGEELHRYATTLMVAVATDHWWVALNIGDGQILFFHEEEAVKLRPHFPKENSKTRAISGETSYLDGFLVLRLPRSAYHSVLLSTDGIYDICGGTTAFHHYALQLRRRCLSFGEPRQPFCYAEPGEPLKDLSRLRTADDCTVVLATSPLPATDDACLSGRLLRAYADQAVLDGRAGDTLLYRVRKGDAYQSVVVTPQEQQPLPLKALKTARLLPPLARWERDQMRYTVYEDIDLPPLELLYAGGYLRDREETRALFLGLYEKLLTLSRELEERGLALIEACRYLIAVNSETLELFVCPEAITGRQTSALSAYPAAYFDAFLGVLSCGEEEMPLFSPGFAVRGRRLSRFDPGHEDKPFGAVLKEGKDLRLLNMGEEAWLVNGIPCPPGDAVPLESGMRIALGGGQAEYTYRAKEAL